MFAEDDSYFSEIVASTSHINFSADGRRIFARNYMTVQVVPTVLSTDLCAATRRGWGWGAM